MPTYEYKCDKCDHTFEEFHGVNDNVEECPKCGEKVRRVFHPVGIIFKGSGFYKTDSRDASDNGGKRPSREKMQEEYEKTKDKASPDKKAPEKKESSTENKKKS
jgi:putative FmdB family regulatory protein